MKKAEFVAEVAKKTGLTKKEAQAAVEAVIETIEEAMKAGKKVTFSGFGVFEVVTRAPRVAKVPGTDKEVKIPETKSVKFKVGKKLKEELNS
jgi:DNA-binding protein HU-beta